MRDYSKVSPQFWVGATGKKIRKQGVDTQLLALYLMTSPHANMLGLYHLPVAYICADTGIPFQGAIEGLQSLENVGFCAYDDEAETVWVYEMATYQVGESLSPNDNQCKGVQNEYNKVAENRFLYEFYDKYKGSFNLKNQRGITSPCKAPYNPLGSQEQEQEQEQEQKQEQEQAASTVPNSESVGEICQKLRGLGVTDSEQRQRLPEITALVKRGATFDDFAAFLVKAQEASAKAPFPWSIKVMTQDFGKPQQARASPAQSRMENLSQVKDNSLAERVAAKLAEQKNEPKTIEAQ